MKIATYNCNSVRTRLDAILGWLSEHNPDYLCLQETKAQDEDFPLDPFRMAGWEVAFKGQKSYNGVAIVSKKPATEVSFGLDTEPADAPRLIHAQYGKLHIVNTYIPQGRELDHEMYAYKLDWFARLKTYFEARFTPKIPVLWCGDINVARHPIDVTNPQTKKKHVCFHQDVRDAFEDTLSFGFTDVFREKNPELVDYSFYDYRTPFNPEQKRGWRIDYILATPPLAKKCTGSGIDIFPRTQPKPSDHTPLFADFNV